MSASPLSPPSERRHLHTRQIHCVGFRRADGLWDIEGHLTDTKTVSFHTDERGELTAGQPIHDMWIRLTVDDHFTVQAIETITASGPFNACGAVTPHFQRLVGLSIAKGWTRAVKERVGGTEGCTHLVELLGPVATTAFQTIYPVLARERAERARAEGATTAGPGRPALIDMCHIFASDGEVVRRTWPEHYTGDCAPTETDAENGTDVEAPG